MSVEKLYDEVIRRHNRQPFHFEKKENCSHTIQANNFICGDRFDLYLELEGELIKQAYFYGLGCAVSKASASVLVTLMQGKSRTEAQAICDQFLRVLKNDLEVGEKLFSDDFKSFSIVHEIPARYDCAALAWIEFKKYLTH